MDYLDSFLKLLRLLLKVTKVTTRQQQWPKIGQNSIIKLFLPEGEVGLRSGPYLLVLMKTKGAPKK